MKKLALFLVFLVFCLISFGCSNYTKSGIKIESRNTCKAAAPADPWFIHGKCFEDQGDYVNAIKAYTYAADEDSIYNGYATKVFATAMESDKMWVNQVEQVKDYIPQSFVDRIYTNSLESLKKLCGEELVGSCTSEHSARTAYLLATVYKKPEQSKVARAYARKLSGQWNISIATIYKIDHSDPDVLDNFKRECRLGDILKSEELQVCKEVLPESAYDAANRSIKYHESLNSCNGYKEAAKIYEFLGDEKNISITNELIKFKCRQS